MNITDRLHRIKQGASNIRDVFASPLGTFALFREMTSKKIGTPKTGPKQNIDRYIGWVYDAVNRNSAERASIPLRLYATRSTGQSKAGMRGGIGKSIGRSITKQEHMRLSKSTVGQSARFRSAVEIEEIDVHPFLDMFNDSFMDCMMLAIFEELTGNSYLAFQDGPLGQPIDPIVLPSQIVAPIVSGGEIVAYKVGNGLKKITIPAELVVHNRFPNPRSPFLGMAPLTAVAMAADRDTDMDIYEGSLNRNHARPDFAVVLKGENVARKDIDAYRKEWNAARGDVANSGKPLFMAGDADIKNFGFSPREMAFLQGRKVTMEQIFGAFGVPPALGKTDAINRANLEAAIVQWTRFTILPRLRMSEASYNKQLMPLYDEPRLFVAYDNPVPDDQEFMLKEREVNLKNYVTTVNEERSQDGMIDVPWGNSPIIQSTGLPLGSTPAMPISTTRSASSGGDKSMQKADPDNAPDISGGANPAPTAPEKSVASVANKMQIDQGKDLTAEFDRVASQGAYDTVKFKPAVYAQTYLDDMVAVMTPQWERGLIVGNIALPEGARIEVGAFIEQPEAQKVISKSTYKFLESEGEGVQREFKRHMQAGLKNGENVQELRKRLTGMFTDERRNTRGLMIARTESARAIELGREASWQESGVVAAKVWDANGDACPFCQAMDGKVVELGANYWNKGDKMEVEFEGNPISLDMAYSEIQAPPLHPNCRCILEPKFIET